MAKKKKTQLKPVARGFATTSVPKKVEEPKEAVVATTPEPEPEAEQAVPNLADAPLASSQGAILSPQESSLQVWVDKFQDRTEKEVARTLKAIEQDRRHAESFPRLDLDGTYIDRILALALDTENQEEARNLDIPEDKVLPRLAITYGVLRRLGFPAETVEQCLKSIKGVDLDEAVDWLHLHCAEEELRLLQAGDSPEPTTPRTPVTPRNSQHASLPLIQPSASGFSSVIGRSTSMKRLDVNAPAFVPAALARPTVNAELDIHATSDDPERLPVSGSEGGLADFRPSTSGWQSPSDDLISEFVRLKMQITDLTSHRRKPGEKRDATFLKDLQTRLEEVKSDYMFDADEAEEHFRIEREKADSAALQARLRGSGPPSPRSPPQPRSRQRSPNPVSRETINSSDLFEDDTEETQAGLFGILEEMPTEEISEQGTVIEVRDMPFPKHWSGRTPKTLLDETIHKVDRYAAITYRCISGASRAKRAAVLIRWEGGRTREWTMDGIACHDMLQAEHYVATVALHSISFPTLDGFAPGANSAAGSQTSFRLLPPIFRDLWDELEAKRRANDDALNRNIWGNLRTILEGRLSAAQRILDKNIKSSSTVKSQVPFRPTTVDTDGGSEKIIADFQARQASFAYQDMLRQREQLPISRYRQEITSILETSQILVLSGETGCGKSTQVPSFILEDQLSKGRNCRIYCTEPRRISAISLAQRVSRELGEPAGVVGTNNSLVGYSVRLESNITSRTRLAYVTNGIALRMLEGGTGPGGQGTAFDELTHVIIDEVHERSIESDFLLIVLKSLLQERPDLRVVLMSATVDAEKISKYFGGTPVLHVPGRTFPVDVRYLEDAIEFTGWKVTENSPYARRGWDKYNRSKQKLEWSEDTAAADDDDDETTAQENVKLEKRYSPATLTSVNLLDERAMPYDLIVRLLERICLEDPSYIPYSSAILIFMPGMGEIRRLNDTLTEHATFGAEDRFKVYPLHSTISTEDQSAVFDIPPPGIRKIVIATNIAETGITIPDITCVIDSGKHREMRFDEKRQISRLVETYVAKSNAAQRRGRAGRVQSGLCFHLFTKVRHDTKMADHPDPEMMRLSLSDLALRIKIMKIKLGSSIEDVLSRALDPPLSVNIQRAVAALAEVGALTTSEEITPMGRLLSKLPTDVHLGKFLLTATLFRCLDPALTIAATLNSKSPFLSPFGLEQEADRAKASFRIDNSDFLTIHNAFASWRRACSNGVARKFCKTSFLSHQNLQQIEDLRQQFLSYLVDSSFIHADHTFVRELNRARYARGKTRFVYVPADLDAGSSNVAIISAALCAGLYPKILTVNPSTSEMRTITNNQVASFHPSSVNFGRRAKDFGVNYLCYFTLMHSKKLYAWETGPIDDVPLLLLCGEPEFKLLSDYISIDRKIRFRVMPKASIALKLLRSNIGSLLSTQLRGKPLTETQLLWNELAMMVLGKVKIQQPVEQQDSLTLVINRR
ncbi:hypothetical protein CERSUDRAFT_110326 [Gelatoporia subvermispora B]|uniref:RNA helicase n=1 Tax=Ceriporiopsis subvermispora (strain B) TaxID=914234 RepID=M2RBC1_CERS8|nr:hypothetical protein CERSUDRAFT_110326 [Gelatoporia subvermispora B]